MELGQLDAQRKHLKIAMASLLRNPDKTSGPAKNHGCGAVALDCNTLKRM
jgi:hypothetical protein